MSTLNQTIRNLNNPAENAKRKHCRNFFILPFPKQFFQVTLVFLYGIALELKSIFKTLYHTIPTFKESKKTERERERDLLKTFWEKDKMLVTSIFSFSLNIFFHSQNKLTVFSHNYFVVCKCFQFVQV